MRKRQTSLVAAPFVVVLAAWLVGLVGPTDPALTQTGTGLTSATSQETRFSDYLDVELVELDTLVTDKTGRPVLDLDVGDFKVSIDGTPVEVTHFRRPRSARTAEAGSFTGESVSDLPSDEALHLVLYFDSSSVESARRNHVITEIRKFLRKDLGAQDQVMLVSVHQANFRVLETWTNDLDAIEAALDQIAGTASRDRQGQEFQELLREMQRVALASSGLGAASIRSRFEMLLARIGAYSAETRGSTLRTAANLQRLVDSLAGLPDRKVILYVGGGLVLNPGQGLTNALFSVVLMRGAGSSPSDRPPDVPVAVPGDTGDLLRHLAQQASVHQVRLYSIDPDGHLRSFAARASRGSVGAGAGSPMQGDIWAPELDFSQSVELRSSLQMLASETGGVSLITGRNYEKFLHQLFREPDDCYSLAARLATGRPGDIHRVEVRVRNKRLQVRHRRSIRTRNRDEIAAYQTLSALGVGVAENSIGVELVPGEHQQLGRNSYVVPILIQLPLSELAVMARDKNHEGQLSIFVTARNHSFVPFPVRKTVLPFSIPNDQILGVMGRMIQHRVDLELTGGPTTIAVGVRDDLDPGLAIATLALVVGEDGDEPEQ